MTGEPASALSPDGKWFAYESDEFDDSGRPRAHVYVGPFPFGGRPMQVTKTEGHRPMWSPDGRELFFENKHQLFVMTARQSSRDRSPKFGNPVALPITGFVQEWGRQRQYDMMPDGKSFLMLFRAPIELAVLPNSLSNR